MRDDNGCQLGFDNLELLLDPDCFKQRLQIHRNIGHFVTEQLIAKMIRGFQSRWRDARERRL